MGTAVPVRRLFQELFHKLQCFIRGLIYWGNYEQTLNFEINHTWKGIPHARWGRRVETQILKGVSDKRTFLGGIPFFNGRRIRGSKFEISQVRVVHLMITKGTVSNLSICGCFVWFMIIVKFAFVNWPLTNRARGLYSSLFRPDLWPKHEARKPWILSK